MGFGPQQDPRINATMKIEVLAAGTPKKILDQDNGRGYLFIQNVGGSNPATLKFDSNPGSVTDGFGLDPASQAGGQGGVFEPAGVPGNAIYALSTNGTTLCIISGRPRQ